ncbi:MAG: heavy-metal-associated domain-containing protein [Paracoccaceae bacterium]
MATFSIPEMTCGHCKKTVEEAISKLDFAATIDIDLDKRTAAISTSAGTEAIIATLKDAGYEASTV